jgi:GNAT superfamily N-acetyltransferase
MTERRAGVPAGLVVRALVEGDLDAGDRLFRLAFGTLVGLADPMTFAGDQDPIRTRWRANPAGGLAAELDGELIGLNLLANWGSVAFFGPLTVHPDYWDRGIGQHLLAATMQHFDAWGARHLGLFTFPTSPKHIVLYQKFGFWPRFPTHVLQRPVAPAETDAPTRCTRFELADLASCRELTDAIYPGLDLSIELQSVAAQRLGETLLLEQGDRLEGLAICHCGPGTEAGSDTCFIKFGAVLPGPGAEERMQALLDGADALARERGLHTVVAGVNLGRERLARQLMRGGFRIDSVGVAMQRPNKPGYNPPDTFVIDDWR